MTRNPQRKLQNQWGRNGANASDQVIQSIQCSPLKASLTSKNDLIGAACPSEKRKDASSIRPWSPRSVHY